MGRIVAQPGAARAATSRGEARSWRNLEHGCLSTVYPGRDQAYREARYAREVRAPQDGGAARSTAGMHMLESLLRWFSPFRLMKDVSRGTREERVAAYRHNRRRRGELTGYMRRWALVLAAAALLTEWFDALGSAGGHAGAQ